MAEKKTRKVKKDEPFSLQQLCVPACGSRQVHQMFIPACGDRIVLAKDWTFTLFFEHRNHSFAEQLGVFKPTGRYWEDCYEPDPNGGRYGSGKFKRAEVTLPAGLVIECDRVYIRTFNKGRLKEGDDYDSITWKVVGKNGKTIQKLRFWAKLADCCNIEFGLEPDGLYRDRVKLIRQVQEA